MQHHGKLRVSNRRVVWSGAVLFFAFSATAAFADFTPGNHLDLSLSFDSQTRVYDVHVPPSYDGSTAVPLVLDLHGAGSDKFQQRLISGMQARSDAEGFIAVWPQGLYNTWNAGICCGGAVSNGIDDVGFLRALVATIVAEANIDESRVYVTGLSNGGAMSQRLACEAADLFAAAAPMAFPIPFLPITQCQPSRPMPVLMFMGTNDTIVPYSGAAPSFAYWRDTNGCGNGAPDETVVTGDSMCETYTSCADGVETGLCSILSTFPAPFEGHVLYANNDLVLSEVAWDFLSQFTLPASGIDHFKCYKAKDLKSPKFAATTVALNDQFGINDGDFDVKKPSLFCNPVNKNNEGIVNAADHLTCYTVKGPKLPKQDRPKVEVANQFGTLQLEVQKPFLLCVPSTKSVLP
jgi:polyhydroxybutyrate depolymerase